MSDNRLKKLHVIDFLSKQQFEKLITVKESDSVGTVLKKLAQHKFLAVPVVDDAEQQYIGMVDMLDLVTFCTAKFSSVSYLAPESHRQMEEFAEAKIGNLISVSGRNVWSVLVHDAPATELLKMLSKKNCHRVAVTDRLNDVVGLVTQWGAVEYLYGKRDQFRSIMHQKVSFKRHQVERIEVKEFVIEAFKKIWVKEVSGIALVDATGKLIGNISASDLRGVHVEPIGELIRDLYQPIKQFLHIRETTQDRVMMQEYPLQTPIVVGEESTLEDVMREVVERKVHRVYVVDENFKPVGAISLGDVLRQILDTVQESSP